MSICRKPYPSDVSEEEWSLVAPYLLLQREDILRAGVARCAETTVDGIEVRLALRCLLPHCPERWPLELYWDAASQSNEIGRAQGVTAAFNGIVRQLRKAGRYEDVSPP